MGACLPEVGRASPALEEWVRERAASFAFESILEAMEESVAAEVAR